jgi:hypothetical protein
MPEDNRGQPEDGRWRGDTGPGLHWWDKLEIIGVGVFITGIIAILLVDPIQANVLIEQAAAVFISGIELFDNPIGRVVLKTTFGGVALVIAIASLAAMVVLPIAALFLGQSLLADIWKFVTRLFPGM